MGLIESLLGAGLAATEPSEAGGGPRGVGWGRAGPGLPTALSPAIHQPRGGLGAQLYVCPVRRGRTQFTW